MAKKISQLTQATEVKSDDVTVIVQDGETKKLPLNMMVTKQDIENKKVAGLAKLDEIEATYENDTYTPTITVKNKSSVKTGEGDEVDYSANVMDGHVKSAILKGQTLVNLLDTEMLKDDNNINAIAGVTLDKDYFISDHTVGQFQISKDNKSPLEGKLMEGKTYTLVMTVNTTDKTSDGADVYIGLDSTTHTTGTKFLDNANGVVKIKFTPSVKETPSTGSRLQIGFYNRAVVKISRKIMLLKGDYTNVDIPYFEGMQSVKMPVLTTSNEDGTKTNILSTPSDLELRGIGDVKDELNLLTGEVTERIGYYKFTGDENFRVGNYYGDEISFLTKTTDYMTNSYIPTNGRDNDFALTTGFRFVGQSVHSSTEESKNMCMSVHMNGETYFRLRKDLLDTVDVDGFKKFIKNNPTEIVIKLSKESVKTVDLMPSGTHPSTTPYCWKNGHIQLSSSGLLPNLEYSVVTSRAGQINQNATMIVKNDKRIFDLEILLAGGLVNTTYQALTLQNQVETGLSKVSLNSETEPDYLLYHMIMKLIEEKAYKLDDLAEKVSVFYLYEKLSDEQFETIYSALYPFVEDEIVEEPVVEELPEVVEDEVIM